MKYVVVTRDDIWKFQNEVERRLLQGWVLQGGISIATVVHNGSLMTTYAQALKKVDL